jgi:hypothetical protein
MARWAAAFVAIAATAAAAATAHAQAVVPSQLNAAGVVRGGPIFVTQEIAKTGNWSGGGEFALLTLPEAVAVQGPMTTAGAPGFSKKHGVQLSVAMNSSSQFGYQPLLVTARLNAPAPRDRTIRFSFFVHNMYSRSKVMTVAETLRLPAGATSADVVMLVPQYQDWMSCGWDVSVDRKPDPELSVVNGTFNQTSANFSQSALVVTDSPLPANVPATFSLISSGAATVRTRRPRELPADWLQYTTLDIVAIDVDDFAAMAAAHPDATAAILRWVRTGGNLWLFNAGARWSKLSKAERALDLPAAGNGDGGDGTPESDDAVLARGWKFVPNNAAAVEPLEGALALSDFDLGAVTKPDATSPGQRDGAAAPTLSDATWVRTSKPYFAVRGLGLGAITAFRRDFTGGSDTSGPVSSIQQSLLAPRLTIAGRLGNRPDAANVDFNNWLVPGVGVAPVGAFQFLISLFVLGIGPLNYWWLKRRRRLPMLLVTVPGAAAVITVLLLTFGMLSDGLGVRVRTRSFTVLDQTVGQSATWARISYYAGRSPRGGIVMPRDTAVYPVLSDWAVGRYGRGPAVDRTLAWGRTQRLERGWIPSRTPVQYLTMNARATTKRLELRTTAQGLRIVNRLGTTVTHVVVQDRRGQLYWSEQLAPDEGRLLAPSDLIDVAGRMRRLFSDHFPEFPPGADVSTFGISYPGDTLSKNIMESQIEAINSPLVQGWGAGSYIAVTEHGVEVDLGVEGAAEEASFHVIRGAW